MTEILRIDKLTDSGSTTSYVYFIKKLYKLLQMTEVTTILLMDRFTGSGTD